MRFRIALLSLFVIGFISQVTLGASGCKCLCSIFYTAGGETKFCSKGNLKKPNCDNWYYDIPAVKNSKQCFKLGENTNDCKGFFKEQKTKDQWTPGEGGRYHSCKIF